MAVIRWNPWNIDRFWQDGWDIPTIPGLSHLAGQGLNLYETDDAVVAEAALPGVPEENIDITMDDNVVNIVGSVDKKSQDGRKNYMSTLSSAYNYAFRLPQEAAQDQEPTCEMVDGILTLSFPKAKKAPPRRVRIAKKNPEARNKLHIT